MPRIITSQHYLDDEIVVAKLAKQDFDVTLSPVFTVEGEEYQVVMDGNHSLAAAQQAGVEPEYSVATEQINDCVALLKAGKIEDFLLVGHMGEGDYIDAITRHYVW